MNNKLYIYSINKDHRTTYFKSPPIKFMESLGWMTIDLNDNIVHDTDKFINFISNNNIKVILCFCCTEYLMSLYQKQIKEKSIILLSYSNDLHHKYNTSKEKIIMKTEFIYNNENVYYCANYYYCFQKFYNINPKRIIKYPTFVDDDFHIEFNNNPINKILLSGTITKEYPARKKLNQIAGYNNNIDVLKHGIYLGYDYIKYLNNFLCCFTCCANKNLPYIIGKFFEIPCSGSLLFAYDEFVKEELKKLGFIDGENYISCTLKNMEEKIAYILEPSNLEEINRIRKNGYEFVWKYHKQTDRLKYINDIVDNNLM